MVSTKSAGTQSSLPGCRSIYSIEPGFHYRPGTTPQAVPTPRAVWIEEHVPALPGHIGLEQDELVLVELRGFPTHLPNARQLSIVLFEPQAADRPTVENSGARSAGISLPASGTSSMPLNCVACQTVIKLKRARPHATFHERQP